MRVEFSSAQCESTSLLEPRNIACPYCGAQFETFLDWSAGSQQYIEDCQVCCRPIDFILDVDTGGGHTLRLKRDDD